MPSGFRNASGVDTDELFEPGTVQAAGFRRSDGSTLAYAARGSVAKISDIGYRTSAGQDLSNLWLPKGSAPPVLGFNGQDYSANAQAPTGQSGQTSALLSLTIANDGTWDIRQSKSGALDPGTVVLASGTWLPAGQSASSYDVQFAAAQPAGTTLTNGAPAFASCASSRTISLQISVPAASGATASGQTSVTCNLRRTGATSSSICSFTVEARGYL